MCAFLNSYFWPYKQQQTEKKVIECSKGAKESLASGVEA